MGEFRLVAAGDSAVIVELEERIDPHVNARVVALSSAIARERLAGVRDVVPAFRSLAVHFDPLVVDATDLFSRLRALSALDSDAVLEPGSLVDIPVCYGGELGPDLEDVARFAKLTSDEVVACHTAREYRAYMVGFLPGFAYLGAVDERIAAPRRATPRREVAGGSVGIAGLQTGVYPTRSPGGWNIIGRTPVAMFVASRANPSLVRSGDRVHFQSVDRAEFDRLAASVEVDT